MPEVAALTFLSNIFQSEKRERKAEPEPKSQCQDLVIGSVLFSSLLLKQSTGTMFEKKTKKTPNKFKERQRLRSVSQRRTSEEGLLLSVTSLF